MIKNILVTGGGGQLGRSIAKIQNLFPELSFNFIDRSNLDLSDSKAIESFFKDSSYDVIINCAAYTAVDRAESEPILADKVNHLAVMKLSEIANRKNAFLFHISTDYVFDGNNPKPYTEVDIVNPKNTYGITKLKGEHAFRSAGCKGAIIRTSWIYSEFGNNFVNTMLRLSKEKDSLSVVFDQVGSPTYAGDLALAILFLVKQSLEADSSTSIDDVATYHYSNEGICSWYDFAIAIFELSNIKCNVVPIETMSYPTPASRPFNSVMNKARIKNKLQTDIPYWRNSLKCCLNRINNS